MSTLTNWPPADPNSIYSPILDKVEVSNVEDFHESLHLPTVFIFFFEKHNRAQCEINMFIFQLVSMWLMLKNVFNSGPWNLCRIKNLIKFVIRIHLINDFAYITTTIIWHNTLSPTNAHASDDHNFDRKKISAWSLAHTVEIQEIFQSGRFYVKSILVKWKKCR